MLKTQIKTINQTSTNLNLNEAEFSCSSLQNILLVLPFFCTFVSVHHDSLLFLPFFNFFIYYYIFFCASLFVLFLHFLGFNQYLLPHRCKNFSILITASQKVTYFQWFRPCGLLVSLTWHKQFNHIKGYIMLCGIINGYKLLCDAHTVLTIVLFHFSVLCVCHS